MTGDFTRNTEFRLPTERLKLSLEARIGEGLSMFDASELAKALLGDSIYSNMMIFGAAWQMGAIPVTYDAILGAVELNGAAVERNKQAFEYGRWAYLHPQQAADILKPKVIQLPKTLDEKIAFRADHLVAYQGKRLAKRYRKMLDRFDDPALKEAVAQGYHKLLAYKDEYEVARLLTETKAKAEAEFAGDLKLTYHLAPPMLTKTGPDGRPVKKEYGARMGAMFPRLAKLKFLRGTPFDPFGRTAERRMERALIKQYEADMAELLTRLTPANLETAKALALLPLQIRGFGPVKEANERKAAKTREALLADLRAENVGLAAE
jgi:indolepyruvate ferredoxin oxidoreductase